MGMEQSMAPRRQRRISIWWWMLMPPALIFALANVILLLCGMLPTVVAAIIDRLAVAQWHCSQKFHSDRRLRHPG